MEPIKLQAVKGGKDVVVEILDAGALFELGGRYLSAKKYRLALQQYDKLLSHFPTTRYLSPTLYNAGLCHEWLGEFQKASQRYKALIQKFGHTKEAVDAGFRLGGCYAELRNYPTSAQIFQTLLLRKDLSVSDRIEAMARKGLAHFRIGDYRSCKSTLKEAIRYHQGISAIERIDTDFFLAMAHYYLAALPHVDFRNLKVDAGQGLGKTLNEKARLLILSQAEYIKTIKVKNPYWATAAGFQVGSLYKEFYTVLLTTLPDFTKQATINASKARISAKKAKKQLIQVYMEEVHKTVKPLLQKAIRVFEKNVLMAERVGVKSNWVSKSRRQLQELKHLLALPPKDAIKLVKKSSQLPEDQPGLSPEEKKDKKPSGRETKPPEEPLIKPPAPKPDEPGRVVL